MPLWDLRCSWILVLCTALMVAAGIFTSPQPFTKVSYYVPFHLLAELSGLVVCFAVFATAWYGFKQTRSMRDAIIGATFLAAGLTDAIHTLSYKGMPDFLTTNDAGTAAGYWVLGRLVVGVGLAAACLVDARKRGGRSAALGIVAAAVTLVVAFAAIMVRHYPESGLWFFNEKAGGLTAFKVAAEYAAIGTYCVVFLMLSNKRGWDVRSAWLLRYALMVAVFAELAFTLYLSPYGYFNALGHIFKTVAYYLVLQALFVSAISKPYEKLTDANLELSATNAELQTLYEQAQTHAEEMERSVSRIGSALSSSLHLEEALEQIASLVADMLQAECVIAALPYKKAVELKVATQITPVGCDLDKDVSRLSEKALSTKAPAHSDDGLVISMPMVYADHALGTITVFSNEQTRFEQPQIQMLAAFAAHAAVAVHNSLSFELESRIANLMQRSLLRTSQLDCANLEIVPYYEPAIDGTLVGGDFYDIIEMPDGRIGLSIGDVSGKGVEAAVHVAMVKYSLRAHLRTTQSPARIITLLSESVTGDTGDDMFVTMFFGILDTSTGAFVYANAGHEPPVHVHADSYDLLDTTGPVLGLSYGTGYEECQVEVRPGDTLILFTDGISEAREGRSLFGAERIAQMAVAAQDEDIADTVTRIRDAAVEFGGGALNDDAAILAVRMAKAGMPVCTRSSTSTWEL